MQKQQRRIVENLPQNLLIPFQNSSQTFPKRFQNRPKPFQNPSQTLPEASPNPPQTLPKPSPKPPVITNWRPNGPGSIMERQFGPTWLQLGVPTLPKMGPKIRKNQCGKKHCCRSWFFGRSAFVLERFLVGFLYQKSIQKAIWRKSSDVHKTPFLVGQNHYRPWQQTTKI